MTYQVLARKWRPSNFTQVVGQDHVVKSLTNALRHNRLHHAFLFTGTRGVGKTTLARILAKAINCENLDDCNPCGQCHVCRAVDEGRFFDLIEVDAASRTKVEDTRDLLDNAQYAPNYGRYKVYLIDEVHMLSGHSFNALLKTLEEPPPHVKFLLATTDPQKIPVTVLSRCLQFNLKRLLPSQIYQQMQVILNAEGITFDPSAVQAIARAADGSMRDGLSLLDQAIVYGSGKVSTAEVSAMLGLAAQQPVEDILTALCAENAEALLAAIEDIAHTHTDFGTVLEQILHTLHRVALAQHLPSAIEHEFDRDSILSMAQRLTPEDVQLYYQIALIGQKDLDLAPDSRMGFEMVMLRMLAFKPDKTGNSQVKAPAVRSAAQEKPTTTASGLAAVVAPEPAKSANQGALPVETAVNSSQWPDLIDAMKLESFTKELANNCVLEEMAENQCRLSLDASHKQLLTPAREKKLQQALEVYFDRPIRLTINTGQGELVTPAVLSAKALEDRQQAAVDAINADPNVIALKERFDARIMPGTIEPV